jgi:hypothetical protein
LHVFVLHEFSFMFSIYVCIYVCFRIPQPPALLVQFARYIDRFEAALWDLARVFHAHWHAPRSRLPSSSSSSSSSASHRSSAGSATSTAAGGSVSSLMHMFASDD